VEQAIAHSVPMPAISAALFTRFRSRQEDTFSGKVLAALRNEFGGHAVKEKE
jgi:6-phosphogluconate dehydrogenase